jgi:VanZ family protein
MALSGRQKVTIILLLFYWPAIFILAHMPVPQLVFGIQVSDKTLHCLAYLVLVFLLWFAVSPFRKVEWRRATVWWILFVVVWYGVFDEWLQGYVGRNPDVMDFFADLAGALIGLIVLTIFPFWSASVAITGAVIFVLTNFMGANLADLLPVTNAAFRFFGYAFFSLLWTRYMYHCLPIESSQTRWLIGALAVPIGLLLAAELFSAAAGNGFRPWSVMVSAVGIAAVVITIYLIGLFRSSFGRDLSRGES